MGWCRPMRARHLSIKHWFSALPWSPDIGSLRSKNARERGLLQQKQRLAYQGLFWLLQVVKRMFDRAVLGQEATTADSDIAPPTGRVRVVLHRSRNRHIMPVPNSWQVFVHRAHRLCVRLSAGLHLKVHAFPAIRTITHRSGVNDPIAR